MSAYVVKTWYVNEQMNENGNYVEIQGRAPGIISWVLSRIGIEPTISINISDKIFEFKSGSWAGRFCKSIPLSKVSSVYYGYSKPWKKSLGIFVVLGIMLGVPIHRVMIMLDIPPHGIMLLIGGLVALFYYILNKSLSLGIFEIGGMASGIEIKRSVIEGKKLDEKDAEQVERILKRLIEIHNTL